MRGMFFCVGEMSTFSFAFSRVTYSLKVSVMRLDRVFVAESRGMAWIKIGGSVSLGPPVGGMMLAQPTAPRPKIIYVATQSREKLREKDLFIERNACLQT